MKLGGVTDDNNQHHPGIVVGGCPIGDQHYVQTILNQKFDKIVSDTKTLTSTLTLVDPMALWIMLYYCSQRQANHWMQHCLPSEIGRAHV